MFSYDSLFFFFNGASIVWTIICFSRRRMCVDFLYGECYRRECRFLHDLLTCNQFTRSQTCGKLLTCNYLHVASNEVALFKSTGKRLPALKLEIERYTGRIRCEKRKTGKGFGDQILCNRCKRPMKNDDIYVSTCNHVACGECVNKIIKDGRWCPKCNVQVRRFEKLIAP